MDKILKFINLERGNLALNYVYMTFLLFSIYLFASIFYDICQIHIYRLDALYYMPDASTYLERKVSQEGRWLNYLLFDFLRSVPVSILSMVTLLSFFYFIFISTFRWTENRFYALIVAFFLVQIPPLYTLLTWPATSAPVFLVLLLSTFLYKRLNIFLFFMLFGILFFATMSNYYYLLPLLFLNHFKNHSWQDNLRYLFFKLIPAWALGFVLGYVTSQLVIYEMLGHFMQIAHWRKPNYVHSFSDVLENIHRSADALSTGVHLIFSNNWFFLLFIFSIIVGFIKRKKELLLFSLFVMVSIILVHYIVILPVGIVVASRTIVATWVGIFAIAFFIPNIKYWQIYFIVPILIFLTSTLYFNNHRNLQWYLHVTNIHYDKLKLESPKNPATYKGVVLYASNEKVHQRNEEIAKIYHTPRDANIGWQGTLLRWAPGAEDSGFKSVAMCNGTKERNALYYTVKDLNKICEYAETLSRKHIHSNKDNHTFYTILGEYEGRLLIEFNKDWDHK